MTGDQVPELYQRIRDLLLEGVPRAEIARRLGISRKTLYKHLQRMRAAGLVPDEPTKPETNSTPEPVTRRRPGGQPGNKNAVGNRGGKGGPPGNKNAVVTGEYETLWDSSLSEREKAALRQAGSLPTLEQVNRQLGLLDIRIARILERINQSRAALAAGVELQLESRTDTDGTWAGQDMNVSSTSLIHTREILERQEKALDRMLQRRERLLALRIKLEEMARRWPEEEADDPLDALVAMLRESRRRRAAGEAH